MAKVRLTNFNPQNPSCISVDFEGRTYDVEGDYVEVPEGVLEKLQTHVPGRFEVLEDTKKPVVPAATPRARG